jgi:hypothetical protein
MCTFLMKLFVSPLTVRCGMPSSGNTALCAMQERTIEKSVLPYAELRNNMVKQAGCKFNHLINHNHNINICAVLDTNGL